MQTKIFTKVFFGKKKFLVLFLTVFSIAVLFLNIQIMIATSQSEHAATPDLTVYGKIDDDGTFRYKMYNDMLGFDSYIKEVAGNDADVYGLVCRNLMTRNNAFNRVSYSVFGVDDSFFTKVLSKYVVKGRIPEKGSREIVIGSLAAINYKLKVGDKFDFPVSLNKEVDSNDKTRYVVSGILSDNVDYFKGGMFLSKETFEKEHKKVNDNMCVMYARNKEGYNKIENALSNIGNNYGVSNIESSYSNNSSLKQTLVLNIVTVAVISIVIVLILLAFLLKGISKKIGLLKSLGVSDSHIIKILTSGLGILSVISTLLGLAGTYLLKEALNKSASDFMQLNVEPYKLSGNVYLSSFLLCVLIFTVVFAAIAVLSRRISPRDAMLKG